VRELLLRSPKYDTAERRDADSSSQQDRGALDPVVQNKVAKGSIDLYLGSQRHRLENPLECGVAHPRGYEKIGLRWRAGDGESPRIALCVRLRGIQQRKFQELAGLEFKTGRLVEMKGDCAVGYGLSFLQLHQVLWHRC